MIKDRDPSHPCYVTDPTPVDGIAGLTCLVTPTMAYHYTEKLGLHEARAIVDYLLDHGAPVSVLVTDHLPSAHARKVLAEHPRRINLFSSMEMTFNVVRHPIQPQFVHLTGPAATPFRLHGQMSATDPVARYFNAHPGDAFAIIRPGWPRTYRTVI
jgi:hypothetical protein